MYGRSMTAPRPATLALEGKLEELSALENPRDAYKWLCAAGDFGHEGTEDAVDDLLETSSLRADDSRFEVAAAHWELAVAYLEAPMGSQSTSRGPRVTSNGLSRTTAHSRRSTRALRFV